MTKEEELESLQSATVEPCCNVVVRVHKRNCFIDEACYSEVLSEFYSILGPDNANHNSNKMDMHSLVIHNESYQVTADYTF